MKNKDNKKIDKKNVRKNDRNEDNWLVWRKNIKHMADCYKKVKSKIIYNNYSPCKFDVVQSGYDLDYVSYIYELLELCPKESQLFLNAVYFGNDDAKPYYESLSRSTLNRIHKKAIEDFWHCLGY